MTPDEALLLDRLADHLETPALEARHMAGAPVDDEFAIGLSIAISLKRIADALDRLAASREPPATIPVRRP